MLNQLKYYLGQDVEIFDKNKYLKELEKINIQIELGQKIIEDINNGKHLSKKIPNEILNLNLDIQERLIQLQEIKQKLEEFLSKIPPIAEYKKNKNRYIKEILEIISIIK